MKHLQLHEDKTSYIQKLGDCIKIENVINLIKNEGIKFKDKSDETIIVIKTENQNEEVILQFWDNTESSVISCGDNYSDVLKPHAYSTNKGHTFDYPTHIYAEPGEYTITLKGDNVTSHWTYVNEYGEWYTELDGTSLDWEHAIDFALPYQTIKAIQLGKHTKSCIDLFYGKQNLIELSKDLFKYCSHVKYYNNCFYGINITNLPDNLFKPCTNAIDFSDCFSTCEYLAEIPSTLFTNCKNATKFTYCFANCYGLTSIPEGLFTDCINAIDFSYCFNECTKVNTIGNNLFATNKKAEDFSYCFYKCKNIKHAYNLTYEGEPTLWEREGLSGYPDYINGDKFAYSTTSVFKSSIPTYWGGTMI